MAPATTYAAPLATATLAPVAAPVATYAAPMATATVVAAPPAVTYAAPAATVVAAAPQAVAYAAPPTTIVTEAALPANYTMAAVTTGVNLDLTGLTNPSFAMGTREVGAPVLVGALPGFEEMAGAVVTAVPQQQVVAGTTTKNVVEIPTVQEHVMVQEIPEVQVVERVQ